MYHKLKAPYPMARSNQRSLPRDYDGPVFIWDIDKTYLDTNFHSLTGLLKIPLELGIDKKAVTGAPELLHALRDGRSGRENAPLYFISASPHQIRKSIERKMLLDGVAYDGISFKDPLSAVKKLRFDEIKNQVPFKLSALLLLTQELPVNAKWYLFGDDAELDAQIYSLFADMVAGRLQSKELEEILDAFRVRKRQIDNILKTLRGIEKAERVKGVLIRLTKPDQTHKFESLDPRILGWASPASCVNFLLEQKLIGDLEAQKVLDKCPDQRIVHGMSKSRQLGAWFRSGG